jgi:fructosamine-3-kinase
VKFKPIYASRYPGMFEKEAMGLQLLHETKEIDVPKVIDYGTTGNHAYNQEYPMKEGWKERIDICNLYPLMVHVNLFGSGYVGSVQSILMKF